MPRPATVRVLKNNVKLFGEARKFDSTIPIDEFNKVSPTVRNALISSGTVEVIGGEMTQDELHELLNAALQRVDGLEKRIMDMEALLASVTNPMPVVGLSDEQNQAMDEDAAKEVLSRKARKGDRAQFENPGDDGNLYIVEGKVINISKGLATISGDDGYEYSVEENRLSVLK